MLISAQVFKRLNKDLLYEDFTVKKIFSVFVINNFETDSNHFSKLDPLFKLFFNVPLFEKVYATDGMSLSIFVQSEPLEQRL